MADETYSIGSMKGILKNAWGYQGDAMNLPVVDADAAASFYEKLMGFGIVSRSDDPKRSVVLARDGIQMQLVENGSDPTQDGCAFEVENVEALYAELKSNGLEPSGGAAGSISPELKTETRDDGSSWKVFFVVAPDGLCYWFGERQTG